MKQAEIESTGCKAVASTLESLDNSELIFDTCTLHVQGRSPYFGWYVVWMCVHTSAHTCRCPRKINFKKPGTCQPINAWFTWIYSSLNIYVQV